MEKLSYTQVRAMAEDGDIVLFHGSWRNPVNAITMFVTDSRLSHAGVVFWYQGAEEKRLLLLESRWPHRQIVTFSVYDDEWRKFELIKAPKPWSEVVDVAIEKTSDHKYSFLEFCWIGVRYLSQKWFNVVLPKLGLKSEVCSETVAMIYGITDEEITPQQLYNKLNGKLQ